MIKTIISLFVLLATLVAIPAQAQTLTLETKAEPSGTTYVGNIYVEEVSEKKRLGMFAFGLVDSVGFGQIYIGPTWYPKKWLEVQFGAGIENHSEFWRVGGGIYLIDNHGSGLLLWENGASGYWYKATYTYPVSKRLALGVFSRRFAGTGPLVEVKASKSYTFWVTAGPDLQDNRRMKAVVGLNISAK